MDELENHMCYIDPWFAHQLFILHHTSSLTIKQGCRQSSKVLVQAQAIARRKIGMYDPNQGPFAFKTLQGPWAMFLLRLRCCNLCKYVVWLSPNPWGVWYCYFHVWSCVRKGAKVNPWLPFSKSASTCEQHSGHGSWWKFWVALAKTCLPFLWG